MSQSTENTERNTSSVAPTFVYALGRIEPQFPNISIEKEFAQAIGRMNTSAQTDRQAMKELLSERNSRYLVRKMCWVFSISNLETYLLTPRDPNDYDLLIDSIRTNTSTSREMDVVIGVRGPLAPPEACNGLVLPVVYFDQLYSFDQHELVKALPIPQKDYDEAQFRVSALHLLDRVLQIGDNSGSDDGHRALNYLAVRYPAIYFRAAEAEQNEFSLSSVEVRESKLSLSRKIVDVIFVSKHRRTDVTDGYAVRVDVEDEFPFLVSKLSPCIEHY